MKLANESGLLNNTEFEFLFPKGKEWFSPKEASYILGCSDQYVRNSVYSGKIMAHVAAKVLDKNADNKCYIRIHKQSIIIYLLETANYTRDSFVEKICEILSRRSDFELMRIEKIIKELLYSPKGSKNIRRY